MVVFGSAWASTAVSKPTPLQIPNAFRGEWNSKLEHCGTDLNDSRLRVSATSLRFYESEAKPLAIVAFGANQLSIIARFSGEGETWQSSMDFVISGNGSVLTDKTSGSDFVRYRCR